MPNYPLSLRDLEIYPRQTKQTKPFDHSRQPKYWSLNTVNDINTYGYYIGKDRFIKTLTKEEALSLNIPGPFKYIFYIPAESGAYFQTSQSRQKFTNKWQLSHKSSADKLIIEINTALGTNYTLEEDTRDPAANFAYEFDDDENRRFYHLDTPNKELIGFLLKDKFEKGYYLDNGKMIPAPGKWIMKDGGPAWEEEPERISNNLPEVPVPMRLLDDNEEIRMSGLGGEYMVYEKIVETRPFPPVPGPDGALIRIEQKLDRIISHLFPIP